MQLCPQSWWGARPAPQVPENHQDTGACFTQASGAGLCCWIYVTITAGCHPEMVAGLPDSFTFFGVFLYFCLNTQPNFSL